MADCLFCQIAQREAPIEEHPENVIVFESDNFYVKPALGHFVEGYCLIVSKEHFRTMAELNIQESAELEEVLRDVALRLTTLYKSGLCTFEHGAVCPANRAGACIDHAHLHVLPTNCDVTGRLMGLQSNRIWNLRELGGFGSQRQSYIYYEPQPGLRLVYTCDERVPSQFMRRVLCEQLRAGKNWDWREMPYADDIETFLNKWRALFPIEGAEIPNYIAL
jgi:diadenosine tetraphosphate (Ap4A) HIT family hydrolase